ncbi:MAG: hypothetical protein GF416_02820 [Candidatus Altiarchaeales archaeon]|nr:hypothetical protein [Candidatus Altiarchaeales archaeon]MBD3416052.1 hypothetical protein [Candidatus Altiarchaeales archaeon]
MKKRRIGTDGVMPRFNPGETEPEIEKNLTGEVMAFRAVAEKGFESLQGTVNQLGSRFPELRGVVIMYPTDYERTAEPKLISPRVAEKSSERGLIGVAVGFVVEDPTELLKTQFNPANPLNPEARKQIGQAIAADMKVKQVQDGGVHSTNEADMTLEPGKNTKGETVMVYVKTKA